MDAPSLRLLCIRTHWRSQRTTSLIQSAQTRTEKRGQAQPHKESRGTVSSPVEVAGSLRGSLPVRPLEPLLVIVFKSHVPILLIARSLLFEIFLSHHVQFGGRRQFCVAGRLLSGFLSDPISRPFFRGSAVRCAIST